MRTELGNHLRRDGFNAKGLDLSVWKEKVIQD